MMTTQGSGEARGISAFDIFFWVISRLPNEMLGCISQGRSNSDKNGTEKVPTSNRMCLGGNKCVLKRPVPSLVNASVFNSDVQARVRTGWWGL
jgi:hypothetical protein